MQPLTVTAIKNFSLSADGTQATFTLSTKYAGDISVTLPAECLKAFGEAASDAGTAAPKEPAVAVQPAPAAPAPSPLNGGGNGSVPAKVDNKLGEMQVVVPKKWGVGAETDKHGVVLIFIDPGAPNQSGFALEPKAAKEMAAALVTKADAVAAKRAGAAKAL